jgi:putative Holliday junction resolvase
LTGAIDVLLAFDFGLRRIGIASGNLLTYTASPVTTLRVHADVPWTDLDRIVEDWRPKILIVGLPSGQSATSISANVTAFVAELEHRYGLEVATVDESLTSRAADAALRNARRSGYLRRKTGKGQVDSQAACLIAEQWMNELRNEH